MKTDAPKCDEYFVGSIKVDDLNWQWRDGTMFNYTNWKKGTTFVDLFICAFRAFNSRRNGNLCL